MTQEEKWHFDLMGYIVLKEVVSKDDVAHMVQMCDEWHALSDSELPAPLSSYSDPSTKSNNARTINHIEYQDQAFADLILNPEIMRVVMSLTNNSVQHLDCAITRNTKENNDIPFHGGAIGGMRLPANDYQAADGKVFATFINAALSLVDIPDGTGFVCVPGSHKSHFAPPDHLNIYSDPPSVINLPLKVGDCVIFTELLRHGGRKWTEDSPRRTVFNRYCTSYASWSPEAGPMEEHRDKLSEEMYELKLRKNYLFKKKVVERLLKEIGSQ